MRHGPAANRIVHDLVAARGGSISAEHGIGQLKRGELVRYKAPIELELMRRVKSALDPTGILNPGKVLTTGGDAEPASAEQPSRGANCAPSGGSAPADQAARRGVR
jgi:hypothetical protein